MVLVLPLEGEIEKIGRTKSIKVNVRVLAATNKNLEEEIKAKRFREDLYYRLNVVQISISPLTERKDDIKQLTNHFFRLFTSEMGKPIPEVDDSVYTALERYNWPGNVRELKNVSKTSNNTSFNKSSHKSNFTPKRKRNIEYE